MGGICLIYIRIFNRPKSPLKKEFEGKGTKEAAAD